MAAAATAEQSEVLDRLTERISVRLRQEIEQVGWLPVAVTPRPLSFGRRSDRTGGTRKIDSVPSGCEQELKREQAAGATRHTAEAGVERLLAGELGSQTCGVWRHTELLPALLCLSLPGLSVFCLCYYVLTRERVGPQRYAWT